MTQANEVFSLQEIQEIIDAKLKIMDVHHKHRLGFEGAFETYADSYVYAGGYFASILNGEEPKDIDFFILEDPVSVEPRPSVWFETLLINRGSFQPATIKHHDISYMKNKHIKKVVTDTRSNIQYIFTDYRTRDELMDSFDYLHTKVSYYMKNLHISKATFKAIKDKRLVLTNQENWYPQREDKFLKRGWKQDLGNINPTYAAALMGARMVTPQYTGWSAHSSAVGQMVVDENRKHSYLDSLLNDITA